MEATQDTPYPDSPQLPFEEQGVCVVETPSRKQFFFTNYPQETIDLVKNALDAREMMSPEGRFGDNNLARRVYANTNIPWGEPLMNYNRSLKTLLRNRSEIEFILKSTPFSVKSSHFITMELTRRISQLGELGDWEKYPAKFLER